MISSTSSSTTASSSGNSNVTRPAITVPLPSSAHALGAQFREIHKNTWLKRLNAEGRKITVGPKKSERSWVVFCVHDDTEALLEGYAEPRQAPAHNPEWIVSLRHTLHVSHALIPNSHEFEFVVALNNEVVRFHATSWEIMQEWVETLRAKLREMKIISPRENLYTKLPEVRVPLLPTRDPTSPLPAPPPVPAALVPGVERVVTHNVVETIETDAIQTITTTTANSDNNNCTSPPLTTTTTISTATCIATTTTTSAVVAQVTPKVTAMSNTLTQNLLNLLTDPLTAYNQNVTSAQANVDEDEDLDISIHEQDELPLLSPLLKSRQQDNVVRNSTRVNINSSGKTQNTDVTSTDALFPR